MKLLRFLLTTILSLLLLVGIAQDGKIVEKTKLQLPDSVTRMIKTRYPDLSKKLEGVNMYTITYLSDNLKVKGYMAEPTKEGKYPCIISNRGGNREFGKWEPLKAAMQLGQMASWGYIVIASQYRGNDGGEGKEEFGGKDINDVLNLIPLLASLPNADTSRIGMEGTSRGGMMTYLALTKTNRLKAAVVTGGACDAFQNIASRPGMEGVYGELVPNFANRKEEALKERSATFWPERLNKTTPLLILQGSADWRVLPMEAFTMVQKLYALQHPVRFILFEGADHGINEFWSDRWLETRNFFDRYVKELKPWPSMIPHGS